LTALQGWNAAPKAEAECKEQVAGDLGGGGFTCFTRSRNEAVSIPRTPYFDPKIFNPLAKVFTALLLRGIGSLTNEPVIGVEVEVEVVVEVEVEVEIEGTRGI